MNQLVTSLILADDCVTGSVACVNLYTEVYPFSRDSLNPVGRDSLYAVVRCQCQSLVIILSCYWHTFQLSYYLTNTPALASSSV